MTYEFKKGDRVRRINVDNTSCMKRNPNLVALTTAERWDGKLPVSIPPDGTVPLMNISPNGLTQPTQ